MAQDARPLRADAARKRAQVLTAARAELEDMSATERQGETARPARLSLDRVAARAGVGVATVYRHFPTREALLEAVYRGELDELCAAAGPLSGGPAPDAALRTWMDGYVAFVESKRAMGEDLRGLVASGTVTQVETRSRLGAAVELFLRAGAADGVFRPGARPEDVVAAMAGAVIAAAGEERADQTRRLLDLLLAGLRAKRD